MKIDFSDDFPKSLNLPSNKLTFSLSGLFVLISYAISVFGLSNIDINKKIIICLGITCFILFVDLIILFIRERELYYYSCFLKQYYDDTNKRLQNAEKELADFNSRLNAVTHK